MTTTAAAHGWPNSGGWSLTPQTDEEKRECETIDGMRRRLQRYAREHALVKSVFDAAYYRGLSGEDTSMWLSFEALCRLERLEKLMLDDAMTRPMPPIVLNLPRQQDNNE